MIEAYCSMILDQWVAYRALSERDQESADLQLARFKHKIKGYLPITDMLYIESADDLKLNKADDGGFVIVTMLQAYEGDFPFLPVIGSYNMLTADYHTSKGWTAVYAYEPPDEIEP